MILRAAIALIFLLVLAASHWKAYTVGQNEIRLEWSEAQIADARAEAERVRQWNEQINKELADAAQREQKNRRDAAASRAALLGLSHAADEALRAAADSHQACLAGAIASADVLKQCGSEYRGLAETCDRHVNDLKTLSNSWPAVTSMAD